MTSVKIEGYRGVATEATVLSPRPTFGPLSLSLATLNLLSHYFNGAPAALACKTGQPSLRS